jgi:hypothetical protein
MEIITTILASKLYTGLTIGAFASIGGPILKHILNKFPTDEIKKKTGAFFYGAGAAVSALFGKKLKYTKPFYESIIEPWVIFILENIVVNCLSEFIKGLRSDNIEEENSNDTKEIPSQG